MSRSLLLIVLALGPACSGGLSQTDVNSYNNLATDLSGAVQSYRAGAATMASPADCAAALQPYLSRMHGDVAGMRPLAAELDDHMMHSGSGDMRCGMDVLSRELERHAAVACTSADMAANRAEALRHCDELEGYADHLRMRGAEAAGSSGMMGGGGMGMGGGDADGGWRMADGGMMGWDHHMPGCFPDGG